MRNLSCLLSVSATIILHVLVTKSTKQMHTKNKKIALISRNLIPSCEGEGLLSFDLGNRFIGMTPWFSFLGVCFLWLGLGYFLYFINVVYSVISICS